ncbi:MAG: SPOR domain-containing protein [Bryobacteraceae bacterium]|jgi:cell division protein FtsN|nr:SPOR domain-containing protein [Bryobacteraceae bacterium]
MPKEDGQFEVVLGNRELLSILFIVVVLLGVFFTMGYVLGRNAASPPEVAARQSESPRPAASTPGSPPSPAGPVATPEEGATSGPVASPEPLSQPGESVSSPPETAVEQPEPAPGQSFWQVAAVKRSEAEIVADVLKKKGFRSLIAPHPTEDLFRVLVGPLSGPDEMARTRAALEAAGFKPLLRKY